MTPITKSPRRIVATLAISAALATAALGGGVAANAAPARTAADSARSAATAPPSSTYWARPLLSTDTSVTGTQIQAAYFKVDSTPTADGAVTYVDEMDTAIGCMAARGFYLDPTENPAKPNSTPAAYTAWRACIALAQRLAGSRDEH